MKIFFQVPSICLSNADAGVSNADAGPSRNATATNGTRGRPPDGPTPVPHGPQRLHQVFKSFSPMLTAIKYLDKYRGTSMYYVITRGG